MIRVRMVDDVPELLKNQLKDFGKILQNTLISNRFRNRFSVDYVAEDLVINLDTYIIVFDTRLVSLDNTNNYLEIINNNIIDDFEGNKRILVVDYALDGKKGAEPFFYTSLKEHFDYALVTTCWSTLNDEIMQPLIDDGYYFIRRAPSEITPSENDYYSLNWKASTIINYNEDYKDEMEALNNRVLRDLCLELVQTDNVNLRYFATILLLVGKSMDDMQN